MRGASWLNSTDPSKFGFIPGKVESTDTVLGVHKVVVFDEAKAVQASVMMFSTE